MAIQRINAGRGHWYKIDGRKADGVTTLIKDGCPPKLDRWAARCVAEHVADNIEAVIGMRGMGRDSIVGALQGAPWTKSTAAAAKGTQIHTLAEKLIKGEEVEVPEHLRGHVQSCVDFLDEWEPVPVLTEVTVASREHNYAGTLDNVSDFASYGRCITDYKTGNGIYAEVCLQLAAYAHADVYLHDKQEHPLPPVGIENGLVVHIRADGYDVQEAPITDAVYEAFLAVAQVARMKKHDMQHWLSTPLLPPVQPLGGAA
jgi:hypothetical protein